MAGSNGTITKGFILKARKIEDSAIAHKAPCARELFDLILRKANFKDQRCGHTTIKRGQWLTTYEETQELLHWRVGYRKLTYSRNQINAAMKTLRSLSMVTTAKTIRGLFITVCNYDTYQQWENYENHSEDHSEDHDKATGQRKNGKHVKHRKQEEGTFVPPTPPQVDEYAVSIGYYRPNLGRDFCQKYEATGWRLSNGKPMTNWRLTVQTWRRNEERDPHRTTGQSDPAEFVALLARGADGLTPRERALQEAIR